MLECRPFRYRYVALAINMCVFIHWTGLEWSGMDWTGVYNQRLWHIGDVISGHAHAFPDL